MLLQKIRQCLTKIINQKFVFKHSSFRQRSSLASPRNLLFLWYTFSFSTVKILQSLNSSFRMTWSIIIPTEKLFWLRRGISMSFRQRSFLASSRNLLFLWYTFSFSTVKILQSLNSSFRMIWSIIIPTEKLFSFDEESLLFQQGILLPNTEIREYISKQFIIGDFSCNLSKMV